MKLLKILSDKWGPHCSVSNYKHSRGFTLIEVLVVLGIITVIMGIIPPLNTTFFESRALFYDLDIFKRALVQARTHAQYGIPDDVYGVKVLHNSVVLFKEDDGGDVVIESWSIDELISIYPDDARITFTHSLFLNLTERIDEIKTIEFRKGNRVVLLSVNSLGVIEQL